MLVGYKLEETSSSSLAAKEGEGTAAWWDQVKENWILWGRLPLIRTSSTLGTTSVGYTHELGPKPLG